MTIASVTNMALNHCSLPLKINTESVNIVLCICSGPQCRYFQLRHIATQLVLDVEGWSRAPGTSVILWPAKYGAGSHGNENQLFYQDDESGTIRSKFCGLCLEGSIGKKPGLTCPAAIFRFPVHSPE